MHFFSPHSPKVASGVAILALTGLSLTGLSAAQAGNTDYSDRAIFNAAVNPNVLETFTATNHFPIKSGVLNSSTNEATLHGGSIHPGDIQPGVTYSYPVNSPTEFQFNIDSQGGFQGGFLNSLPSSINPSSTLTVTFDSPTLGFGFDTNFKMGPTFNVVFNLADGSSASETLVGAPGVALQFYGFQNAVGIRSAQITGTSPSYNFALDNFAFRSAPPVPEASTTVSLGLLLVLGLGGLVIASKRRKASAGACPPGGKA